MAEQGIDQETYNELQEFKNIIVGDIPEVETLEIIYESVQLTHSINKPADPTTFRKYVDYDQSDESLDVNKYAMNYLGMKWSFCRVYTGDNNNYRAFLMISKNELGGEMKGMIVVVDSSNMMVVATCKADALRNVNSKLTAKMDECY